MDDNVAKIKDRVDVVDLIGGYLKLNKAGVNFKARCPFHNEKSASFFVSPERQIWHCFGCGVGGDIFEFVKQIEGVEFVEALRILANRAGVTLARTSPQQTERRHRLYDVVDLASRFFEKQLHGSRTGQDALAYLKKRGVSDASISSFRLGYAPDTWDGLTRFLLGRGFGEQELVDAGVVVKRDRSFDRFRSRIMFPLADASGRLVGFTGRVFGALAQKEDVGKYVNTPQTSIYDKSRLLYGLDRAKLDIRQANRCLLVEGNLDVVMSHQVGVAHVVAASGTALTEGHVRMIKRYTPNIDLCFDADAAGDLAARRSVGIALAHGMNVRMLSFTEEGIKDPADFVLAHNEAWKERAQEAKPFLQFYFEKERAAHDMSTAEGKKAFSNQLLPLLASIANKVEQAHWVSQLALALRVQDDIVYQELSAAKPIAQLSTASDEEVASSPVERPMFLRLDPTEETLISMLLRDSTLTQAIESTDKEFMSDRLTRVVDEVRSGGDVVTRVAQADPDMKMSLEFAYLKSQELWNDFSPGALAKEMTVLLGHIRRKAILKQLEQLEFDIKAAEQAKETAKLTVLMGEFAKLSQRIATS